MKSKIKYLILIILLLFISSGLITFAMFRLYKNASGNVSAARWNVSFKNGSTTLTNNFNINLANATWTNPFGTVATGKIAPGSETTFNLTIDATGTETDVDYKVELGNTNVTDFEISSNNYQGTIAYSNVTNNMIKTIPITIKWLGSINDDASKKVRDNNQSSSVLNIPIIVSVAQKMQFMLGDIVFYDPKTTNICNSTTFNLENVVNGTSTCYKWRVISPNTTGDSLDIQMDHDLVNPIAWNSSGNSTDGPVTILTALKNATSSWTRVPGLTYSYDTSSLPNNYGILNCLNGTCTFKDETITNVKTRLITLEEVIQITKNQTDGSTIVDNMNLINQNVFYFSRENIKIGTTNYGIGNTNLSWLIENTMVNSSYPSGSTTNIYGSNNQGYWTLTPVSSNTTNVFRVFYDGHMDNAGSGVNNSGNYGARPVIKVLKTDLN